ncbi:MAG: transcription antitermination protein NusB [Dysgonamonadaceae bacterium]|jgi:N utilization substance protein B|nr:transcription antitermination protein NusB [Dysgonamonadaceae bacterium]
MINRILIRIKVLQIVYAYCQKNSADLNGAEKALTRSLQKAFDLYHYLLILITALTDAEQKKIDALQYKFLPTEEERNPNLRLANNRLAEQLRTNETMEKFVNRNGFFWMNDDSFIRNLLNTIVKSNIYKDYLESDDTYESDQEFWRKVFKEIILENAELPEILEEKDIYWTDDLDIIGTFVLKTIKRFKPAEDRKQKLLPMFRDEEDHRFAIQLLHRSILEHEENTTLINKQIQNWDLGRIASIDLCIMQIALAEIKNFPSIPISVSLNEYIELAWYYSTPKSGTFINGILDGIVTELKNEHKLLKI